MAHHTVTTLRPRSKPPYTDTAAVDDIHALITSTADPGRDALAEITEIIGRTGRPMVIGRDIEVTTTQTALGWPVIQISSGDVAVTVRQDPAGTGLQVDITAAAPAERDTLTVTLDGQPLTLPR